MADNSPGPWEWWYVGIEGETMLVPKGCDKIASEAVLTLGWVSCGDGTPGKEPSPEDMSLISAAPDLLEALKAIQRKMYSVQKHVDSDYALGYITEAEELATKAITKATTVSPIEDCKGR